MKLRTKKIVLFIIIFSAVFAAALLGLRVYHQHNNPTNYLNPADANGNCPAGYVNYGVPLGCITKEQYQNCQTAKYGCPICLASYDFIDTAEGEKNVTTLKIGDLVWSVNKNGWRVLVPIKVVGHMKTIISFYIRKLILADGRTITVSASHPTSDGRKIGNIRVGDTLSGSKVTSINLINYSGQYTYDLLPNSDTGYYWANGVLLGSTLK